MRFKFEPTLFHETLSLSSANHRVNLMSDFKIPVSNEITGIEVRLSRALVIDNMQPYIPWIIRYSDFYILTAVTDDLGKGPQAVSIKGFSNIDDNEELPVDRTLYYWKQGREAAKAPGQIHMAVSIVKSKERIRNTGKALKVLQKSEGYKTLINSLINAVVSGGSSLICDSLLAITDLLGSVLGNVEDTPLITAVYSFTDIDGWFDKLGRHTITVKNRYAQIDSTLIVLDANRIPKDPMELKQLQEMF